ncbi:hypothetical protein CBR_g2651 [Chara braunii]|uniref:Uncharacterized protein n=1 Tax=Chara braunii TaxID=69332 RepID=A0A388KDJ2_CHABU|nr:hypothetical protein CBR_g2651 [Chara braunii]|eukprot:GBG68101.1 hypothetical protein CBR_g2651 [Chara braunii]
MASAKNTSTSVGASAPEEGRSLPRSPHQYFHSKDAQWFLDFIVDGNLVGPTVFMRPAAFPDAKGAADVHPVGTILSSQKQSGGLLKLQTNIFYDMCRLPYKEVKGVMVSIKNFAGYDLNMLRCRHVKGLYDIKSMPLPPPLEYLDLALKVPKECSILPRDYVFRLLPAPEGSSDLAQETPLTKVGHESIIHDTEGQGVGHAGRSQLQIDPSPSRCASGDPVSSLTSPDAGTHRVATPKILKLHCQGDTYSLRDEARRESGSSGQEVGGNEVEGMGTVRGSSNGEPTSSEKKRERQKTLRDEVAEQTRYMKRMKGSSKPIIGEDEGQARGGGDSARQGIAAAGEPSQQSKRKLAAEEGNRQKKTRRRKTSDGTSGGERTVGRQYDEAAAFWLEYEGNDDGEIVEKEHPIQLVIDPRKVCDIPPWERYYNHHSLTRDGVKDIKNAMLRQFHEEKAKIWKKNALVLAPIYKPVTQKPERARGVHKDVFKPEDKDKYFYYPVNGQHTVAVVKELDGEPIFKVWKMHSWPARVVWLFDEDFGGYLQVSLAENTRHTMSLQRSQKTTFEDMREAWEKQGSPNDAHWRMARKATTLADKDKVEAICNALRQWMPLVIASDEVFRKGMEFYDKWAEEKLLGGDGKMPLSKSGKYMPDKSSGLQAIPEMGVKEAAGETKMGWLVRVPRPQTKKKTQLDDKFFVVVKEPDIFCWQSLADMTDDEKLSILENILSLNGVFVQSANEYLKRQHKSGIKEMVATRKVDRMMLRMFHYVLFLEFEEDAEIWRYGSQFFRTEEQLMAEFAPQSLTKQVWVELRKHFHGAMDYMNTCERCLSYEKKSLDETKRLYDDDMFPTSFEKSVRSILRRTEEKVRDTIRVRGDVRHIKWQKLNRFTNFIHFGCPPSQTHIRLTEIRNIV